MSEKSFLHRQIHPSFVVNDIVSNQAFVESNLVVSSGAFNPYEKDVDKLSMYNGEKFSAKDSYEHYTKQYPSYGVLSITVEEVISVAPLTSTNDDFPFDGHSFIDFSSITSKNQKTKKAGQLRDIAVNRNWTYKPE
jgi:hypothetical protein